MEQEAIYMAPVQAGITRNDCIRSLIDNGHEHEKWVRMAAQLRIDVSAQESVAAVEKAEAIRVAEEAGLLAGKNETERKQKTELALANNSAYQDAVSVASETRDALARAEAEVAAAKEQIRVYCAVAGLLECAA